jgi:hypothetical protein
LNVFDTKLWQAKEAEFTLKKVLDSHIKFDNIYSSLNMMKRIKISRALGIFRMGFETSLKALNLLLPL